MLKGIGLIPLSLLEILPSRFPRVVPGLPIFCFDAVREFENDVPGRGILRADGGRTPEPTLAESEVADVCRDIDEAGRDDVDDAKEVVLGGPAIAVAFTAALTGLELGGAAGLVWYSPARSARVFRCFAADSEAVKNELMFSVMGPGRPEDS